jgi:sugar lactone lactonase YvrE
MALVLFAGLMVVLALAAASAGAGPTGLAMSGVAKADGGFQFTEGPIWRPDGKLLFSDIPADTIYCLGAGERTVFRKPSGNSNGLTFDRQNRLVACEHGNRRVSLTMPDGEVKALATHYEGKRLNSPNDVAVRSDGGVYFTDPPYGVKAGDRELEFQGVYRIAADGKLTLLVDDFDKPNGLCFSPDEKVLYIADTDRQWLKAFDVKADGTLENGRVFCRADEMRPDGIKCDMRGDVLVAAVDGVWIYGPGGELIQKIATPERPANLAFGSKDGRTLYITAQTSIYSVLMRYPGADVPHLRRPPKE